LAFHPQICEVRSASQIFSIFTYSSKEREREIEYNTPKQPLKENYIPPKIVATHPNKLVGFTLDWENRFQDTYKESIKGHRCSVHQCANTLSLLLDI